MYLGGLKKCVIINRFFTFVGRFFVRSERGIPEVFEVSIVDSFI